MTVDLAKSVTTKKINKATLAGGCFWCIEGAFNSLKGIVTATSGYMGGQTDSPTYKQVCQGDTGHAEVVQLVFDADIISYREILEIFFTLHNPTHLNRQGDDVGSQYRSEIFFENDEQQQVANHIIEEISASQAFDEPLVTQVTPVSQLYIGEEYHQGYFNNNPENQYCQAVVSPKLTKFRKTFVGKLK